VALILALAPLLRELSQAPQLHSCGLLKTPRGLRVDPGALESAVRILAVVKRHTVDTEDVCLQVPLLRGTVGTVATLERPVTYGKKKWPVNTVLKGPWSFSPMSSNYYYCFVKFK
jgi:hypothetical protein